MQATMFNDYRNARKERYVQGGIFADGSSFI